MNYDSMLPLAYPHSNSTSIENVNFRKNKIK